jgi:hypothetical protein
MRVEPAMAGAIVLAGLAWFVGRALELSPSLPWAQAAGT